MEATSGGVLRKPALAERAHQQDAEAEFVGQWQDGPQFRRGDEANRLAISGTEAVSRVAETLSDGSSREPPSSRWRRPDAALHEGDARIS
jgi:hypothetical protein